jgi:NAD(P)-dependent dehydrogenase (short-subunit alcohol dehydrogenase family)
MTNNLTGKVALVTGGSRGIGAAIAKRLARDGAAVAITYAHAQQKADEVVHVIEAARGSGPGHSCRQRRRRGGEKRRRRDGANPRPPRRASQ